MVDRAHRQDERGPPAPADATRLQIGVLGPVVVVVDGAERPITAPRPRAVLACLAMRAGTPMSADRLLDEVWGEHLPDTGVRAVAYQIARLRNLLEPDRTGEGTLITTTAAGYRLDVDPDDIDANHVEHLVDEARSVLATDPSRCEQLLVDALARWRGRPFADLGDEPFVTDATRHLDLLHLAARRTLAEARIALGRPGEVIADLEALATDHPLDEALIGLLMTALHHSGRTAEALHVYDRLRRRLATELGIDPSHHLQHLERRLLDGDDASPASGPPARPRPIPVAASSFFGRTTELTTLADWLATARLVTVCGFGGLGKTRLAQHLARTIADRYPDGVWYVDLAPITDPTVVVDTIITAGGLTIPRGGDPLDHLLALLGPAETLLVLDNCEHLTDDLAELTTQILHHAPSVHVLATSRVPLGIPGEALFTVHPLDPSSARELLAERARLARPGFTIDDTNRDHIERLAAHLDGIPLAIELAAARLTVLTLDQILEHLDERLELLTNGRPHPDPRHHSMTAVIDWSYHLLDPTDQQLLCRLTVCAGGFDLDAVHAIGTPDPASNTLPDTLDHLTHLTHAALVEFDADGHPPRCRILEPIRQHVAAKLTPDERHDAALAHTTHYAAVAAEILDLWSSDYDAAFETSARELGNLRAAMSWAYRHDHPKLGLAIARHVSAYFFDNQMYRELLRWLRAGLDLVHDDDDETLAAAVTASFAARDISDVDAHRAAFARVRRGLDSDHEPWLRAELLSARSSSVLDTHPRAAEADTQEAIEMRASAPIRTWALLCNRIDQSWLSGDIRDSPAILQRLDEVRRAILRSSPTADKVTAGVAACEGRWEDVVVATEPTADRHPASESSTLTLRAEALAVLGRRDEAVAVLATLDPDSYERRRRYADRVHAAIDLRRGEPLAAVEHLATSADEITRDGRRLAIAVHVASLLAVAACDLGRHETAAVLFGHAEAEQRRLDIVLRPSDRPLAERAIETCRAALGPDRYDELAARGATTEWRDLPRVEPDTA